MPLPGANKFYMFRKDILNGLGNCDISIDDKTRFRCHNLSAL